MAPIYRTNDPAFSNKVVKNIIKNILSWYKNLYEMYFYSLGLHLSIISLTNIIIQLIGNKAIVKIKK
jgi:hypothetical protein